MANADDDIKVFEDGSVWYPGFVIQNEGSMAAEYERRVPTQGAMHDQAPEKVFLASNDELTAEASIQQRGNIIQRLAEGPRGTIEGRKGRGSADYGRVVLMPIHNELGAGVWTPIQDEPEDWTVTIQAQALTPAPFLVVLQWMVGDATFLRRSLVYTSAALQFPLTARRVMVDVQSNTALYTANPAFANGFPIAIGIARGNTNTVQSRMPFWRVQNVPLGTTYALTSGLGPGALMSAIAIAEALPAGGPFYPMFFDKATIPVPGDAPFLVMAPMASVGDSSSFDDELSTATFFQNGLAFGLSTTADVYTAPGAGGLIRVDVKVGAG